MEKYKNYQKYGLERHTCNSLTVTVIIKLKGIPPTDKCKAKMNAYFGVKDYILYKTSGS